ncbi:MULTISPECIES: hypothetical protein [unclassified Luteimonas]|uniref:hypothetical protein n=1 Tax=unclassified Luteimonas TaxID=2629088 RepID=UPI0016038B6D|nr:MULTISPECIES: hypothetical protein [unclassified Luteimonas]MBB1472585.1 hypothetical protein [Luteimonas sp. MC1782]MBB6598695.1 hypothetical protein [Luteimonas sp. MC1825]QOC88864.1 hypothetical protein IDM46_03715 [Luteimonas sp. MC1825]
MEETIKNYLKQTILSLIPASHRRTRTLSAQGALAARRIARIQTGMPPPASTPIHGALARRRAPHHGYGRSHYRARPLRDAGIVQPMFRIT